MGWAKFIRWLEHFPVEVVGIVSGFAAWKVCYWVEHDLKLVNPNGLYDFCLFSAGFGLAIGLILRWPIYRGNSRRSIGLVRRAASMFMLWTGIYVAFTSLIFGKQPLGTVLIRLLRVNELSGCIEEFFQWDNGWSVLSRGMSAWVCFRVLAFLIYPAIRVVVSQRRIRPCRDELDLDSVVEFPPWMPATLVRETFIPTVLDAAIIERQRIEDGMATWLARVLYRLTRARWALVCVYFCLPRWIVELIYKLALFVRTNHLWSILSSEGFSNIITSKYESSRRHQDL